MCNLINTPHTTNHGAVCSEMKPEGREGYRTDNESVEGREE